MNFWAQIASQDAQREQKQQNAVSETKPAQKQIEKKQVQVQKQAQKQKQKQELTSLQSRKLIVHVKAEMWENFNSYSLRNQINDAFLHKENITKPVIASVIRSRTGFSVILVAMPEYSADFLLEKQQI